MTERRQRSTSDIGTAGYQRLAQRLDESMAALSDRIDARFDRVEEVARKADFERSEMRTEFVREINELRRDHGEMRDALGLSSGRQVEAAAKGAAAGAKQVPRELAQSLWQTRWGKATALAAGFTALVVAANNVPDAVRAVERTWAFIANRDVKAVTGAKKDD